MGAGLGLLKRLLPRRDTAQHTARFSPPDSPRSHRASKNSPQTEVEAVLQNIGTSIDNVEADQTTLAAKLYEIEARSTFPEVFGRNDNGQPTLMDNLQVLYDLRLQIDSLPTKLKMHKNAAA